MAWYFIFPYTLGFWDILFVILLQQSLLVIGGNQLHNHSQIIIHVMWLRKINFNILQDVFS